ncbi:MAG: hypothetical protein UCH28_11265, partial [Adlercreutzia sp.]|nr:hypothetical protein [Adlercreutzia sp.]
AVPKGSVISIQKIQDAENGDANGEGAHGIRIRVVISKGTTDEQEKPDLLGPMSGSPWQLEVGEGESQPDYNVDEDHASDAMKQTVRWQLGNLGYTVWQRVEEYSDVYAAGTVISVAEVKVAATEEGYDADAKYVKVVVSKGPKGEFDDYISLSYNDAVTALKDKGYTIKEPHLFEQSDAFTKDAVMKIEKIQVSEEVTHQEPKKDENGDLVYVQKVDEDGTPMVGEDGKPVYEQEVDANGDPVVDGDGNPVYKVEMVDVTETVMKEMLQLTVCSGQTDKTRESLFFTDCATKTLDEVLGLVRDAGYTVDYTPGTEGGEGVEPTEPSGEGVVYEKSDDVREGSVISVERVGDFTSYGDGAVKITVSSGKTEEGLLKEFFETLRGMDVDEATNELGVRGIKVDANSRYENSDEVTDEEGNTIAAVPAGKVLCVEFKTTTSEDGETTVDKTTVVFIISAGPSNASGGEGGIVTPPLVQETTSDEPDYATWKLLKVATPSQQRFTTDATGSNVEGSNHGHHPGHSGCWGSSADEGSGDISIGYKGQGSFLVDFRQVTTTPSALNQVTADIKPESTSYMEQGYSNIWYKQCPNHSGCYWSKVFRHVYGTPSSWITSSNQYANSASSIWAIGGYHGYWGSCYHYEYQNGNQHYDTVGGMTYNTGAHLQIVQNIKGNGFDAYYLKIKAQALPYLDKVTVNFSKGNKIELTGQEIRQQYYEDVSTMEIDSSKTPHEQTSTAKDGTPTSVQVDADGNYYFRFNLMKYTVDENGNITHHKSFGKNSDDAYRDTFDEYDDAEMPLFKVNSIVYDVTINQGTFNEDGETVEPDYGRWFGNYQTNAMTWLNKMSFEVTGRFLRLGTVESTADVNMTIGGDYSGDTYVHKAAQRYDSPSQRAQAVTTGSWSSAEASSLTGANDPNGRGSWSYRNYHRTGGCCWGYYHGHHHYYTFDEGKMRHLRTSNRFNVYDSRNFVRTSINQNKGSVGSNVMGSWNNNSDNGSEQRSFGGDDHFFVSFYRWAPGSNSSGYSNSDYRPWGNYISSADNIRITDDLPTVYPDQDIEYYGFVTNGLRFIRTLDMSKTSEVQITDDEGNSQTVTGNAGKMLKTATDVWGHLNPQTNYAKRERERNFDEVAITINTTQWEKDPSYNRDRDYKTKNGYLKTGNRTFIIRKEATYLKNAELQRYTQDKLDPALAYYTKSGDTATLVENPKAADMGSYWVFETPVDFDLNPCTMDESWGLDELFSTGLDNNGDAIIYFNRAADHNAPYNYDADFVQPDQWNKAPVYGYAYDKATGTTVVKTGEKSGVTPLTFNFPDGELVTSYSIDLGPYGGDADATTETARAYDGDAGSP